VISVSGVEKTFAAGGNAVHSLRGVSFDVVPGEFLVAIGASGSGKTTLLRSVAGLEWPDAGRIALRGETVFDAATGVDVPPQRRRIGMVFQSYAIWPHLSVLDNVMLPLRNGYLRMKLDAAQAAAMRALELVGIGALAARPAPQLSGGQQQRVALARALAVSSDVLLMDEPLSNLDAQLREDVRGELKALSSRVGATVLYVTHDRAEALAMADRVLVLDHGSVLQIGSPAEIYDRPASRTMAEFMGRVNWIAGTPAGDGRVATPLGPLRVAGDVARSGAVTIGIRPEGIGVRRAAPGDVLGANAVAATAVSVQFLGSHAVLEADAAGVRLAIETRGTALPAPGDALVLDLPPERMFVFAEDTAAAPPAAAALPV
jgi:ABC-type Fe3+/spermidine/putrescine transport system ATPase subunit